MSISMRSIFARAARWFLLGGLLAAGSAQANQVFTTDCAFDFKDDFGIDQVVCAAGDVDTKPPGFIVVFPEGNVCVVRAGTLAAGGGIADVTAGGCNTVVGALGGGAFFDEPIWLPPLQRGLFQVVLDEDQNGVFGGIDFAGNVFRVGDPVGANIDVAAIKAAAGARSSATGTGWRGTGTGSRTPAPRSVSPGPPARGIGYRSGWASSVPSPASRPTTTARSSVRAAS